MVVEFLLLSSPKLDLIQLGSPPFEECGMGIIAYSKRSSVPSVQAIGLLLMQWVDPLWNGHLCIP